MNSLARDAREATGEGDLYMMTRKLSGKFHQTDKPVKDRDGNPLTTTSEHLKRWAEHFKQLLKRTAPTTPPVYANRIMNKLVPLSTLSNLKFPLWKFSLVISDLIELNFAVRMHKHQTKRKLFLKQVVWVFDCILNWVSLTTVIIPLKQSIPVGPNYGPG